MPESLHQPVTFEIVVRPTGPEGVVPVVVVCVLTKGRPGLLGRTLRSLALQDLARPFACLVADNDPAGREGAAAAAGAFATGRLRGAAVVVARPGHCSASNGAFAAARSLYPDTPFVAMIDDDETAEPDWLRTLLETQARTGADLVGGPVEPRFERRDPGHFAHHPVFRPFFTRSGPVPFLYGSGNVLMRAAVLDRVGAPAFDPAFDFTGGGDFDFFLRCRALGFSAWFEAAARATETVPLARTRLGYVLARSMRYGAINVMIERKAAPTRLGAARVSAKSLCLLGLAPLRALARLRTTGSLLVASHPVMESIGRFAAAFGRPPEQYRPRRGGPA